MAEDGYDPNIMVGPVPPKRKAENIEPIEEPAEKKAKSPEPEKQDSGLPEENSAPVVGPLPGAFMNHLAGMTEEEKIKSARVKFNERELQKLENEKAEKPQQREEWMLKPGEQKINTANALKNRTFNQTSQGLGTDNNPDNPFAANGGLDGKSEAEMKALQAEQDRLQKEIDEYNLKHNRTESLLEKHKKKMRRNSGKSSKKDKKKKDKKDKKKKGKKSKKEKKSKKSKKSSKKNDSSDDSSSDSEEEEKKPEKQYRTSFNWETDMKINKIDKKHLGNIYSSHSQLNSRFKSTGPQDRFM